MDKKVNVDERICLFLENNTYVFIKLISGSVYNGYIKVNDDISIKFEDDKLGEIPILKREITIIDYSNKKRGENDDPARQ